VNHQEFTTFCEKSPTWFRFHPVAAYDTAHGKILIGESHRQTDPEFEGPHVQHIYAIDRDGEMDLTMQKLYYALDSPGSPGNRDREARIAMTLETAMKFMEDSIESGRFG
tara:strand:- start:85 stop:414 length:330 start_codon:yes stop_codon:yes gene_type:complete